MACITVNNETLNRQKWIAKKFNYIEEEAPNLSLNFEVILYPYITAEEEISDEEMLTLPEKIGMFSFLSDSEEDIYSESDGVPLG